MTGNNGTSGGATAEAALAMLRSLENAPGGAELLAQIRGGRELRDALLALIERAFLEFSRNALDRYARTTGADQVARLKTKLIEQRLAGLSRSMAEAPAAPDLSDTRALAQHLLAQLWAAGQNGAEKSHATTTAQPAANGIDKLLPLRQTLAAQLERAVWSNLDNIAALGSIELTLKSAKADELEGWRDILYDAAREVIEGYRDLGENLRHAQLCVAEMGRHIENPRAPSTPTFPANRHDLLRRLEGEIRRAERHRQPLSLALLGPDHLENIKLLIGPQAANEVLRRYLENMTSYARAYDTITGCNPHRVLWLLPGAEPEQGVKALRNAQDRLAGVHYHYGGRLRPLPTFSAGIVGYARGENYSHFLTRAEVLAARARSAGPSRIEYDRRLAG